MNVSVTTLLTEEEIWPVTVENGICEIYESSHLIFYNHCETYTDSKNYLQNKWMHDSEATDYLL